MGLWYSSRAIASRCFSPPLRVSFQFWIAPQPLPLQAHSLPDWRALAGPHFLNSSVWAGQAKHFPACH